MSSILKDPYPNNELTICSDAISNPNAAGSDNNKHNSIDLFVIYRLYFVFNLTFFAKLGNATVQLQFLQLQVYLVNSIS